MKRHGPYHIVTGNDIADFENAVAECINDGYMPWGGVVLFCRDGVLHPSVYFQTMVDNAMLVATPTLEYAGAPLDFGSATSNTSRIPTLTDHVTAVDEYATPIERCSATRPLRWYETIRSWFGLFVIGEENRCMDFAGHNESYLTAHKDITLHRWMD